MDMHMMIFRLGLRLDSSVHRVSSRRFVLGHRLGFRRDAPVFQMERSAAFSCIGLGSVRGASVVSVIRSRWEDRFANKTEMATPSKPCDEIRALPRRAIPRRSLKNESPSDRALPRSRGRYSPRSLFREVEVRHELDSGVDALRGRIVDIF
jgi:hypothetical protein